LVPATSGPESYNLALSLRRPNAVEDALVRGGVLARAITVIAKGESEPLVQTGTEFASRKISRLRSSSSRRRTNFPLSASAGQIPVVAFIGERPVPV
jgi:outer membrane protein OmpA-like peptidoglycan-associated protein